MKLISFLPLIFILVFSCKDEAIDSDDFDNVDDGTPASLVSISTSESSPSTNITPVFTAVFSEAVQNVQTSDFVVTTLSGGVSGSITDVSSVDSINYSITLSLTGVGTIRVDLDDNDSSIGLSSDSFTSGSSLVITSGSSESVLTINRGVSPATNPTSSTSVEFDVTFSGSVTNVQGSDFTISNTGSGVPSLTNVSGAGANWTVTISVSGVDGAIGLNLNDADSSILDGSSDPLSPTTHTSDQTWTVDSSSPSILFINRGSSPATNPTNSTSLEFDILFTEPVSPLVIGDFSVSNTGTGSPSITNISGSGSSYTITVNATGVNGDVGLDLMDADSSIMDAIGNPLTSGFYVGDQVWSKTP